MQQNGFHYVSAPPRWCSVQYAVLSHLIQLLLRLLLHASNVLHRQVDPLVDPAEQLSVEVGEYTPLYLERQHEDTAEKREGEI